LPEGSAGITHAIANEIQGMGSYGGAMLRHAQNTSGKKLDVIYWISFLDGQ
jgi:hypothetical protein